MQHDSPFRPNYEGYALGGWILGALAAVVAQSLSPLPDEPFQWMLAVSVLMGLWRAPAAWQLWATHRALRGKPLTFITKTQAQRLASRAPTSLWLGYGFAWTPHHAQLAWELLGQDHSAFLPQREGMGSSWIHGLEGRDGPIYQPLADTEGHTLIVGTTGSGKTRCFDLLITQAILREEAVIIIDPKGDRDLRDRAQQACLASGNANRFVYFHPGFPEHSVSMNPLKNFNRGTEIASRIAALIPSETGADPFKAFGQMALNNIVQGLLLVDAQPDLRTLRRYLEGGPEGLVVDAVTAWCLKHYPGFEGERRKMAEKARSSHQLAQLLISFYQSKVQQKHANSDLEGLVSMFQHDRTHYSKMVASLMPILNMLTSSELGSLLSPAQRGASLQGQMVNSAGIINDALVAYIGLDSLTDAMVGSAIGSLILSDLTAVAGDRYNYGVDLRPVNIFIDEAAEVVNDPFIQLLNKGRGARMRCVIATQTFADFAARTGSDAKARQVLGNINNLIALRVMDTETQKYITDNLPKTRLRYIMQNQGMSSQSDNPVLFSGNHGERLMEEEGDLFPPALLGQLPNLEYIAKLSGGRIVKGRLPILRDSEDHSGHRDAALAATA
jgi:conjugal transfer pilus assembly protein TraD